MLNGTSVNISSQLILQEKHLSKITASFDNNFEQIIVNRRIKATKIEPKTTLEKNLDEIKADHVKIITSLDKNISDINSN